MRRCPWILAVFAPALAGQVDAALAERIAGALERARPALLRNVANEHESRLALMCLAALHDQVPRDHPVLAAGLRRLWHADIRDTYGLALRLVVAAELGPAPERAKRCRTDLAELLSHQTRDGGFGYDRTGSTWDLSNTQYAALGLLAAGHLGLEVEPRVFERLVEATLRARAYGGGFGYRVGNAPTLSMTVAGIAVLEICARRLGDSHALAGRCRGAIASGWSHVAAIRERIGDDEQFHNLYAHYGLERAAILSGVATVGDVDWYARGAAMIVDQQTRDGAFVDSRRDARSANAGHQGGDAVATAFAVLFLRRAFRPDGPSTGGVAGPTTPDPSVYCHALPPDADAAAVRAAAAADVARGARAVPDLLRALRSEHRARRDAAARAVVRITGIDFRFHPDGDAERNALALRDLERWWLDHRPTGGAR